jgi:CubicO group peptidase (beta-lactamase class C family)
VGLSTGLSGSENPGSRASEDLASGSGPLDLVARWPVGSAAVAVLHIVDGARSEATGARVEVAASIGPLDTVFAWASVTKLLVALSALVAVEEGTLDLDDPAGPPGSTVRHLLAHASGLEPDSRRTLTAPGRRRIYSNAGFEVLAETLTQRAGMAFDEYMSAAVLVPLAMPSASLVPGASPASGAQGTLRDLCLLASELLVPRLVSSTTMAKATTVAFAGLSGVLPGFGRFDPCDWGLGFEIRDDKDPHWTGTRNSPATFGHFGQSGSFVWVDPVAQVACAALGDRDFGPWAQREWPRLADAVLARWARP